MAVETLRPGLLEEVPQRVEGVVVVVHHEHVDVGEARRPPRAGATGVRTRPGRPSAPTGAGRRAAVGRSTVKVAPWFAPRARRADAPAVGLDEVADDGEADAQPAVGPGGARVGLPEALEDVGQEVRVDAGAVVPDLEPDQVRAGAGAWTSTRPPGGVNLMALESRFQTTCCRRAGSPRTGPALLEVDRRWPIPLAVAAGRTVSTAASTAGTELGRAHVELEPARARCGRRRAGRRRSGPGCVALRSMASMARAVAVGVELARCAGGAPSPARR